MAIITNAGCDDRLSPQERAAAEIEVHNQGIMIDAEAKAKAAAARRDAIKAPILQAEAQSQVTVGEGDDAQTVDRVVVAYQMEEPEYDASVPTLAPYVIEYRETDWWPLMRRKGARGGLRPVLPPKAWEALIDSGMYCLKCLGRHASMNPAKCKGCDMTAAHRENVLAHLEDVGEKIEKRNGHNRAERRAINKHMRRSKGGVVLPACVGG